MIKEEEAINERGSAANRDELEFASLEKQRARAFLRERFLRVVTGIVGW